MFDPLESRCTESRDKERNNEEVSRMVSDKLPESVEHPLEKFVHDVQLAPHHVGVLALFHSLSSFSWLPFLQHLYEFSLSTTKFYPNERAVGGLSVV